MCLMAHSLVNRASHSLLIDGGEANDVLRLVQEPFCLMESHVSIDPRSRLQTPKRPFSKSQRLEGTGTAVKGASFKPLF